jgi:hypothetical protein
MAQESKQQVRAVKTRRRPVSYGLFERAKHNESTSSFQELKIR